MSTHPKPKPTRTSKREPSSAEAVERASPRSHGDSYSEVAREDELIGTASSHVASSDRRTEEPSDAAWPTEREDGA